MNGILSEEKKHVRIIVMDLSFKIAGPGNQHHVSACCPTGISLFLATSLQEDIA